MSKYIRTKNGIHLRKIFDKECSDEEWKSLRYTIIKQANKIEDLCDNFIVEYTNGEHMMFYDFYHLQRHYKLYGQDYHHVAGRYGCIWVVGKGLIYVAKMNAKGELELI